MNQNNQAPPQIPQLKQLKAATKRQIYEMGIRQLTDDLPYKRARTKRTGIICLLVSFAGVVGLLYTPVPTWLAVALPALVALVGLYNCIVASRDFNWNKYQTGFKQLEKDYGNVEERLREIQAEFRPDWPVYETYEGGSYITNRWYITDGYEHFVKIEDIAAVVGVMGEGTFIITAQGHALTDMYGGNPLWGLTVERLLYTNPYILLRDDNVTMPDGRVVSIDAANKAKDYALIAQVYHEHKAQMQADLAFEDDCDEDERDMEAAGE